ncbi:MAG: HPr-rel-A system PqqD family peptide chaperone [Novosphingobium sp.]
MADPLFVADPPGHVKVVALDALTALYHRPSGQTHIVSEPMPEILAALEAGPMTAEDLLARLAKTADVAADPGALAARLGELEAIGLVFRT